jgi:hypothetical protein
MKRFFMVLVNKAAELMEQDPATRDRSATFRFTVITLLSVTVIFIIFYTIKTNW